MFRRLFGETVAEQIHYLQPRVIATLAVIVLWVATSLISGVTDGIGAVLFVLIMLFVWGWRAIKALFGFASVGVIFSGNVVIGVAIFIFYVMAAYIAGIVVAFIATGRYAYLKIANKNGSRD